MTLFGHRYDIFNCIFFSIALSIFVLPAYTLIGGRNPHLIPLLCVNLVIYLILDRII